MSSVRNAIITPKRAIICIDNVQACPPPPKAPSKLVVFPVLDLQEQGLRSDTPPGFFLEAPCNITSDRSVQVKNNHIKLLPRKSRLSSSKHRVWLQTKGNSIDWAAGATITEATKKIEVMHRGRSARSA